MNAVDISKKYFELSNARDLDSIAEMFDDNATYSSDHTGLHFGKADIMAMVQGFFAQFPYLHWRMDEVLSVTPHIVEIHFTRLARDASGDESTSSGIERIVVANDKLRHVEVRRG